MRRLGLVVSPGLSAGTKSAFAFRASDKSPYASKVVQLPESGTVRVTLELPR